METLSHRCVRLLSALEELVAQEALLIAARDFHALRVVQERAAPLVEALASVAGAADLEVRRRVAALTKFRENSRELLARQIEGAREELQVLERSQHRVARIAPVYRHAPERLSRRQLFVRG
jgi:hypothetical protein